MREDNLEDRLSEVRETVSGDLPESLLQEWMSVLQRVIEHEGECFINPH
jgi:hypothetical protein